MAKIKELGALAAVGAAVKQGADALAPATSVKEIPLAQIDRDEHQPRVEFDPASLNELADSIREIGVLEPVLVRRQGKRFMLISGERRWRAAALAGLKTIPAIVREDMEDGARRSVAQIVENLQREDLTDLEIGRAMVRLKDDYNMSQRDIAKLLGKPDSVVSRLIAATRPEHEEDLTLCGGSASVLEVFRALDDNAKDMLRTRGQTLVAPEIARVRTFLKNGGILTAENLEAVIAGGEKAEPEARAPAPAAAEAETVSPALPEEAAFMPTIADAGEEIAPHDYSAAADEDESAFFAGANEPAAAPAPAAFPSAESYRGDIGTDVVASDYKGPSTGDMEDTLISLNIKGRIPVAQAREIIGKLGGDRDADQVDLVQILAKLILS